MKVKPENRQINKRYKILLFYKYVSLENTQQVADWQRGLCTRLKLTGRIIIAKEGINATVEGTRKAVEEYWSQFIADSRFADTHLKTSFGTGSAFPRLSIKIRSELVSLKLGDEDFDPNELTGKRVTPDNLHEWFEKKEDFIIIDMRNDYEHRIGHFDKSVMPSMKAFRELPHLVNEFENLKNKKVITVCTGGVRCEKASGYLVKKGFKDIYQLDGGIVSYMEKYPKGYWNGSLYTFDGRVAMDFDNGKHDIIGRCKHCESPTEMYVDCADPTCHIHYLSCESCLKKTDYIPCCSPKCEKVILQKKSQLISS